MTNERLSVCYFGIYNPQYSRNSIILKGLKANNINVIEVRAPSLKEGVFSLWDLPTLFSCYLTLIYRFLKSLQNNRVDAIVIGYPGWHVVPIAKCLSLVTRRPTVFDAFYSIYDADVLDRKIVKPDSIHARLLHLVDRISCKLADAVLVDTLQQINFFSKEFGIEKRKLRLLFVGSDEQIFKPVASASNKYLSVIFWGKYIPLHGAEFILTAAKKIEDQPIRFTLIGKGQTFRQIMQLRDSLALTNVCFIPKNIPYKELAEIVSKADICLGIFGITDKAMRVIPNKVYESLAAGKPLITGDSPAVRALLQNRKNVILCKMGDADSLANAILLLHKDEQLRERIAQEGYSLFRQKFTTYHIGRAFVKILKEIILE